MCTTPRRHDHGAARADAEALPFDGDGAPAADADAIHAAAGVEARAVGDRARHVADVHALPRALRAALEAAGVALAALRVAVDRAAALEAERRRALREELVVAALDRALRRVHAELVLEGGEDAVELGVADERAEAEAGAPVAAHVVGEAPDDAGVDRGAAPDRATLQERHRHAALGRLHAHVADREAHRVEERGGAVLGLQEVALLDHHDVATRRGEDPRRRRAAGAGAHDDVVGLVFDARHHATSRTTGRRAGAGAGRS